MSCRHRRFYPCQTFYVNLIALQRTPQEGLEKPSIPITSVRVSFTVGVHGISLVDIRLSAATGGVAAVLYERQVIAVSHLFSSTFLASDSQEQFSGLKSRSDILDVNTFAYLSSQCTND